MKWHLTVVPRTLHFKEPAGTSRGVYLTRDVWYVVAATDEGNIGVGECAPLHDLSCDWGPDYAQKLDACCRAFENTGGDIEASVPLDCPSIRFGLETATAHAAANSVRFWSSMYSQGLQDIPINGLVWMGSRDEMLARLEAKLEAGFRCIKLKIGAIDFEQELGLMRLIRERHPDPAELEIRLDANGAFSPEEAPSKLERLAAFKPHSIEQPIKAGQWQEMAALCRNSPIPVALDEELIGINDTQKKMDLIGTIRPRYLVLKPSLHGGMQGAAEWFRFAMILGTGFWTTSALESNVGLNAIAQWCAIRPCTMPQGLGTGQLFTDNIEGFPNAIVGCSMHCNPGAPEPDILGWLGVRAAQ